MFLNVLEELNSALEFPSVYSLRCLTGILERNSEVGAARSGALGRFWSKSQYLVLGEAFGRNEALKQWRFRTDFSGSVSNLEVEILISKVFK